MSTPTTTDDLTRELDILEARLADGEKRIAEAKQASVDTTDWEAFWNELLHSYEAVYRRLHVQKDDPETYWDDLVTEYEKLYGS